MFEKLKNKLQKIQESDEQTKKRWLIGLSAATMIVIIFLWLALFNFLFEKSGEIDAIKQESAVNFFGTFKNGLKSIGGSVKEGIKNLKNEAISRWLIEIK